MKKRKGEGKRVFGRIAYGAILLICATAGSAVATSMITGRQIKDGSIAPRDLSAPINANLARGGSSYLGYAAWNDGPTTLSTGSYQPVVTLRVPAKGSYLFTGKVVLSNLTGSPTSIDCFLTAGSDNDLARMTLDASERETIPFEVSHTFTTPNGLVAISCLPISASVEAGYAKIQAVQVQTLKRNP